MKEPDQTPTLADLIARLENATEGNKSLDGEIAKAVGKIPREWLDGWLPALPTYTTSLDAALTLVPPRWTVDLRICGYDVWTFATLAEAQTGQPVVTAHKVTAPLAVCLASLKARSAS